MEEVSCVGIAVETTGKRRNFQNRTEQVVKQHQTEKKTKAQSEHSARMLRFACPPSTPLLVTSVCQVGGEECFPQEADVAECLAVMSGRVSCLAVMSGTVTVTSQCYADGLHSVAAESGCRWAAESVAQRVAEEHG
jgi:hypothetical protein